MKRSKQICPATSLLILSLMAVLVTACKDTGPTHMSEPKIIPEADTVTINVDGGTAEVVYNIVNPYDDGTVSVTSSAAEWLCVSSFTESVIAIDVDANPTQNRREAGIVIVYTYDGGKTVLYEINVIQECVEATDHVLEAQYFTGQYYGGNYSTSFGPHSYILWLSSKPLSENDEPLPGGIYYFFDIYGPAPENGTAISLPAGEYRLSLPEQTDKMTFSVENSGVVTVNESGESSTVGYADGYLAVSLNSDSSYAYYAVLTDVNGETHFCSWSGPAEYADFRENISILDYDLSFEAVALQASYVEESDGIMEVVLEMTDITLNSEGELTLPGTVMYVQAYMKKQEEAVPQTGTYNVTDRYMGDEFSIYAGGMQELIGGLVPAGSYAYCYDKDGNEQLALAGEGTMEITVDGAGGYSISCKFRTPEGYSLECSYYGPVSIRNFPGPISTLDGDYTLNITTDIAYADYYGDYYITGGGNWIIQILPGQDNPDSDGLMIDLVSGDMGPEGISEGTYTSSYRQNPQPFQYYPGYETSNGLGGTMYVSDFDNFGTVGEFAPAESGELTVTRNEDGSYTFTFSFLDDRGNTWDGQWTGSLDIYDMTAPTGAVMSASRSHNLILIDRQ